MKKIILAITVLLFSVTSIIADVPEEFVFQTIEGITPDTGIKIYTQEGYLYVETEQPTRIEVFSITGKKMASEIVTGPTSIALTKGIYLVRIGEKVQKVIVK